MLASLLHHPGKTSLFMTALFILASSLAAHSDTSASNDNYYSDYSFDGYQNASQEINALWLEAGMKDSRNYREGDAAVQELTQSALQYCWRMLVRSNPGYDRYTPVVSGHFSVKRNDGLDYGFRLTGNTIKLRFEYSF